MTTLSSRNQTALIALLPARIVQAVNLNAEDLLFYFKKVYFLFFCIANCEAKHIATIVKGLVFDIRELWSHVVK